MYTADTTIENNHWNGDKSCITLLCLQVIGFHEARKPFGRTQVYSGMIHCFHVVYKEEGLKAFYKGASVSVMKVHLYEYSETCLSVHCVENSHHSHSIILK